MTMTLHAPTLLTLPCEVRNEIYRLVFDASGLDDLLLEEGYTETNTSGSISSLYHTESRFDLRSYTTTSPDLSRFSSKRLAPLRTCRQIHQEAQLLALTLTPFHVSGDCTYPDLFDARSRPLNAAKMGAIRQLTLTARTAHLRAMNEAWAGLPFGHPHLRLDKLVIIPRRPDVSNTCFAEIAELSQCHTLAYILAETLKTLRNVRALEIRNQGCFTDEIWQVFYKSLLFRLWRWGGNSCGVTFESGVGDENAVGEDAWHRMHIQGLGWRAPPVGREVGDEVVRLAGHIPGTTAPTPIVDHDAGF